MYGRYGKNCGTSTRLNLVFNQQIGIAGFEIWKAHVCTVHTNIIGKKNEQGRMCMW